jgi:hypothetical protein
MVVLFCTFGKDRLTGDTDPFRFIEPRGNIVNLMRLASLPSSPLANLLPIVLPPLLSGRVNGNRPFWHSMTKLPDSLLAVMRLSTLLATVVVWLIWRSVKLAKVVVRSPTSRRSRRSNQVS